MEFNNIRVYEVLLKYAKESCNQDILLKICNEII